MKKDFDKIGFFQRQPFQSLISHCNFEREKSSNSLLSRDTDNFQKNILS